MILRRNAKHLLFAVGFIAATAATLTTSATTTLVEKDDWKFTFGGFVESDMALDSTRSFTEVVGNGAVAKPNTFDGDNGRMQFSTRNSRFAFGLMAPVQDGWNSKGYMEYDLLGYYPSTNNGDYSESGTFTNPTVRLRHGYLNTEKDGWQFLAGQTWTLFGWQPAYVMTSVSVAPMPGMTYERSPQFMVLKNIGLNNTDKVQAALSIARPAQRDSDTPNFDYGLRYVMGSRRSGFAAATSDVTAEPASIAVSGTTRNFVMQNATGTSGTTSFPASAFAVDTLIPVIASDDGKSTSGTLTILGEFTSGSGYSDQYPNWSGGLKSFTTASAQPAQGNLDKGQGGIDPTTNTFQLVKLQTWNASMQYHFGSENPWYVTAGYGQITSTNVAALTNATYDRDEFYLVNVFHDCTKQIRFGLEYAKISTYYLDGTAPSNNRYQASFYYRF